MFFQGQNGIGIQGIQGPRGEPGEKVKERTENLRIEYKIKNTNKKLSRNWCLNSCVAGKYRLIGTSWPKGIKHKCISKKILQSREK